MESSKGYLKVITTEEGYKVITDVTKFSPSSQAGSLEIQKAQKFSEITFPTAQSLQLSGMIKKEQINFGNIVIMMSKLAQSQ